MKNTALHEAAALGSEGLRCAQVLLRYETPVHRTTHRSGSSIFNFVTFRRKEKKEKFIQVYIDLYWFILVLTGLHC